MASQARSGRGRHSADAAVVTAVTRLLGVETSRVVCAGLGAAWFAQQLESLAGVRPAALDIAPLDAWTTSLLGALGPPATRRGRALDAVVLLDAPASAAPHLFAALHDAVRPDGIVVAVASTRTAARPTRAAMQAAFVDSGWDPIWLEAVRPESATPLWPDSGRRSVLVDGAPRAVTAAELEDLDCRAIVVAATHHRRRPAVSCSVIVDLTHDLEINDTVRDLRAVRRDAELVLCVPDDIDVTALARDALVVRVPRNDGWLDTRNAGARAANGRVLCFVAPGTAISHPSIAEAVAAVERDVNGAIVTAPVGYALDRRTTPGTVLPRPVRQHGSGTVRAVGGSPFAVARAHFLAAGGFDASVGTLAEVDLCLRLAARGLGVQRSNGDVVPNTRHEPTREALRDRARFAVKWDNHLPDDDEGARRAPRRSRATAGSAAPIVWSARVFDLGGIADEARQLVLALDESGADIQLDPTHWPSPQFPRAPGLDRRVDELVRPEAPKRFVHVMHGDVVIEPVPPYAPTTRLAARFRRHPRAVRTIGRVMCDSDVVPPLMLDRLGDLDDLWVPTHGDRDRLTAAGIGPERVFVVPEPIDAERFSGARPLPLPGVDGFVFLAVAYPDHRKGLDLLLSAFVDEFDAREPVTLVVKLSPGVGSSAEPAVAQLRAWMHDRLERKARHAPRVVFLTRALAPREVPRLYAAADAYVLPTRGEGWGRPFMEAMASGLPTIATRFGGQLEFMDDTNSFLVDYELVDRPGMPGIHWGEASQEHLRDVMRLVFSDREEAARRGARARADIAARTSPAGVAAQMLDRLEAIGAPVARRTPTAEVVWQGPRRSSFAMAIVNQELASAVAADDVVVRVDERSATRRRDGADITVRSEWPPDLHGVDHGRLVLAQPWEFGSAPTAWIDALGEQVDELWAPSRWVRDCYVRSGADPDRVHVVPHGVDAARFRPDAPPFPLPTERGYRFLFVGGTLVRKGIDVLVDAYRAAFTAHDDVCLVIKDHGASSFYRNQNAAEHLRALAADSTGPSIVYVDADLPRDAMPGVYTACDCLVHPYRGEGFGLPILEAMACGLPVVAPRYGPALDVCDDETAVLLPAAEVPASSTPHVDGFPTAANPWWAAIERDALVIAMRALVTDPERGRALGRNARARVLAHHTWDHAATAARVRLRELHGGPSRSDDAVSTRLSVCVVARDAARLIGATLDSVVDVADEIVVLDTGSRDDTRAIARSRGAEVHEHAWTDDFATARNAAVGLASGAWILMLDADQTLDPSSADELRNVTRCSLPWGFLVRVFNYIAATGADVLEHPALRLFPNHPAFRYEGHVHEQLRSTDPAVALTVAPTGIVVHHHGARPQHRNEVATATRDARLLEVDVAARPDDAFAAYNLGRSYRILGRTEDARSQLERCVTLASPRAGGPFPQYLVNAHLELAELALADQRFDAALVEAQAAHRLDRHRSDARYLTGRALHGHGQLHTAAEWYRAALDSAGASASSPIDRTTATWRPLHALAVVALQLGSTEQARRLARLAARTTDDPAARRLVGAVTTLASSRRRDAAASPARGARQ